MLVLLSNTPTRWLSAQTTTGTAAPPPTHYYCGAIEKLAGIPDDYQGQVLYDRFGNTWTVPEIQALSSTITGTCVAGVFKLQFDDVPVAMQATICEAFTYVSATIGGGTVAKVPIQIDWVVLDDDYAAEATNFQFYSNCSRVENTVQQGIRNATNDLPPGAAAGLMRINSGVNWYTGEASGIANGQTDLYTVVLHEALHLLGVASLIGDTQNATPHYTEYDRYLAYKTSTPAYEPLIIKVDDATCCSKMVDNPNSSPNLLLACEGDIFFTTTFGTPTAEIVEVAYKENGVAGSLNNIPNKLSHFDISCGSGTQYVMHPGIGVYPNDYSTPRRTITPPEIEVLCRIGYPAAGSCGNCALFVQDDNVTGQPIFLFNANGTPNSTPSIQLDVDLTPTSTFYNLLSNDISPNVPIVEFDIIAPHPGLSITEVEITQGITSFLTVVVTDNTPGIKTFQYRLNLCGQCQYGTVYLQVLERPISLTCEGDLDCNLVCFGDFEDIPCITTYFNTYPFGFDLFTVDGSIGVSTPDVYEQDTPNGANMILSWEHDPVSMVAEVPRIPLSQPIYPGCRATISFRATAGNIGNFQFSSPRLQIFGITDSPCPEINQLTWTGQGSVFELCSTGGEDISAICMNDIGNLNYDTDYQTDGGTVIEPCVSYQNLDLIPYTVEFEYDPQVADPQPITELLLFGTYSPNEVQTYQFALDDLYVTSDCNNQISVTPTVTQACSGGQAIIKYDVCLQGGGASAPVQLQASVPAAYQSFVSFVPGGGFDANGLATFNLTPGADCNGGSNTTTLTLTVNIASNITPGTVLDLNMDVVSGNTCINSSTSDGDVTLTVQDCNIDLTACKCGPTTTNFTVGANPSSVTNLSNTALPNNLNGNCISVNGKLIIDGNLSLDNCTVIMNQGAEIEVPTDIKLTIFNNSVLQGCNHMWKGIVVYGLLDMKSSKIYDAQWAVEPRYKSTIWLDGNTFDRNYVGVHLPVPTAGQLPNGVLVNAFKGNSFLCSDVLKSPYDGQQPNPGLRTFAGVFLNNFNGVFKIGTNNTFDGTRNGIVSLNAGFEVNGSTFTNMLEYVPANTSGNFGLTNIGVFAKNCRVARVKDCTINKLAMGIVAKSSSLTAENNNIATHASQIFSNNFGISISGGNFRTFIIKNNRIKALDFGIGVYNTPSPQELKIHDNSSVELHLGPFSSESYKRACILLDGCKKGIVYNNTLTNNFPTNKTWGVYMNNCEGMNIGLNRLYNLEKGVFAQGSNNNYFYDNTADYGPNGSYPDANRNGFVTENGSNEFCNNFSDNHSEHGFYFAGECSTTDFKCSNINNDATGLYLWADNSDPNPATHPTTVIGKQDHLNNTWNGSEAYHEEGIFEFLINQSQFFQKIIPAYQTTYTLNTGDPTDWFLFENEQGLNCSTCDKPTPLLGTGGHSDDGGIRSSERLVAGDGFGNDAFQWMASQRLFQRIVAQPTLKQDFDLAQFFDSQSPQIIGKFAAIEQRISQIAYGSDLEQQEFGKLSIRINTLGDLISFWLDAPESPERSKKLSQLNTELDWVIRSVNGYEKYAQSQRLSQADNIALDLNALQTNYLYGQNEKEINSLLLAHRLWMDGGTNMSEAVWTDIKSIADQCPHTGGWPVYKARSIYRQHVPTASWDINQGCSASTENRSFVTGNTSIVEVYPNPAQSELTIVLQGGPASFQLWNIHGKLMLEQSLAEGKNGLDLQSQSDGLYLYKVQLQDGTIKTGKIVLVH